MNATTDTLQNEVKELKPDYINLRSDGLQKDWRHRESTRHTGRVNYKQVARILQHLCRDLHCSHPQLKIPSAWMLRCLVFNAYLEMAEAAGKSDSVPEITWQQLISNVLRTIHRRTDVGLEDVCWDTQLDGTTPLFPNHEQFDEWDAFRLSQALLYQLDKELN